MTGKKEREVTDDVHILMEIYVSHLTTCSREEQSTVYMRESKTFPTFGFVVWNRTFASCSHLDVPRWLADSISRR
jgi:hypothetical protein